MQQHRSYCSSPTPCADELKWAVCDSGFQHAGLDTSSYKTASEVYQPTEIPHQYPNVHETHDVFESPRPAYSDGDDEMPSHWIVRCVCLFTWYTGYTVRSIQCGSSAHGTVDVAAHVSTHMAARPVGNGFDPAYVPGLRSRARMRNTNARACPAPPTSATTTPS